jgi:diguanylate cyclase (GGDEF)-like protein
MANSIDFLHAKLLIVDDQKANAFLLEQVLRRAGYVAITSTKNPGEVSKLHLLNHYDLILLDLEMPGMDGFQVMEDLKELEVESRLPVLVITAHPAHKERALQFGAKDFITKPFELAELLLRVHNMLEVRLLQPMAQNQDNAAASLAWHDPLTGLGNRRLLRERMALAIAHAREKKTAMAVVRLDLDGFKQIGDPLRPGSGDPLLKMAAARLAALVCDKDTLAHLGRGEFMLVLTAAERADWAAAVALKAIEELSRPYEIEGHAVTLTASAGIGIFPSHGEDVDTLMKSADLTLYKSKPAGNNTNQLPESMNQAACVGGPQKSAASTSPLRDSADKQLGIP